MRKTLILAGLMGLGLPLVGCMGHAVHQERKAAKHEHRAQRAAAHGDYKEAGEHQWKANDARNHAGPEIRDYQAPPVVTPVPPPPVF